MAILAAEMAWIFNARGVHRETLAALQLFREAAERETLTVELVRRRRAHLERAPGDRFALQPPRRARRPRRRQGEPVHGEG
ncbi:MAG TPA: hypothetical protein VMW75_22045 [Thermoanaerobaculia bacterium]|nr:hypothetical protein [Thermoanaerobaculia bacterium]